MVCAFSFDSMKMNSLPCGCTCKLLYYIGICYWQWRKPERLFIQLPGASWLHFLSVFCIFETDSWFWLIPCVNDQIRKYDDKISPNKLTPWVFSFYCFRTRSWFTLAHFIHCGDPELIFRALNQVLDLQCGLSNGCLGDFHPASALGGSPLHIVTSHWGATIFLRRLPWQLTGFLENLSNFWCWWGSWWVWRKGLIQVLNYFVSISHSTNCQTDICQTYWTFYLFNT